MMKHFQENMQSVIIRNYRIEHRVYIMDEVNDDSSEYSMVFYYRIDKEIRGGQLIFYDDDGEEILDTFQPKQGNLVIFFRCSLCWRFVFYNIKSNPKYFNFSHKLGRLKEKERN